MASVMPNSCHRAFSMAAFALLVWSRAIKAARRSLAEQVQLHQLEQLIQRIAQQVFLHGADVVIVNSNLALRAGIQTAGRDAEQCSFLRQATKQG